MGSQWPVRYCVGVTTTASIRQRNPWLSCLYLGAYANHRHTGDLPADHGGRLPQLRRQYYVPRILLGQPLLRSDRQRRVLLWPDSGRGGSPVSPSAGRTLVGLLTPTRRIVGAMAVTALWGMAQSSTASRRGRVRWAELYQGHVGFGAHLRLERSKGTPLAVAARGAAHPNLELDHVSLDRRTVTFRSNAWRRLKTHTSWRVMPMCPQLDEILRGYLFGPRLERSGRLLFPSFETGEEAMLVDVRKRIDRFAIRAGWKAGSWGRACSDTRGPQPDSRPSTTAHR